MKKAFHGTSQIMLQDLYECYRIKSYVSRDYRLVVRGVPVIVSSENRQFLIVPNGAEEYEVFIR